MKKILGVYTNPRQHWVGDGFPVRSLFTYESLGEHLSPFLLLDHAGPMQFPPTDKQRGVGQHPHRGFETVTIVYHGEVQHRDSAGNGGVIGPGDVQWMTAGAGIQHEEFHSQAFSHRGGLLEMVQLWVNLPAKHKMTPPRYQGIVDSDIPKVTLAEGAGHVRVIAGEYARYTGPAQTFSPVDVWDVRLHAGHPVNFTIAQGRTLAVVVLHGSAMINASQPANEGQLVVFSLQGEDFLIEATSEATVLVLSGEPLNEPIAGHGPFVMNTAAEIDQAIDDFNHGRFSRMNR